MQHFTDIWVNLVCCTRLHAWHYVLCIFIVLNKGTVYSNLLGMYLAMQYS